MATGKKNNADIPRKEADSWEQTWRSLASKVASCLLADAVSSRPMMDEMANRLCTVRVGHPRRPSMTLTQHNKHASFDSIHCSGWSSWMSVTMVSIFLPRKKNHLSHDDTLTAAEQTEPTRSKSQLIWTRPGRRRTGRPAPDAIYESSAQLLAHYINRIYYFYNLQIFSFIDKIWLIIASMQMSWPTRLRKYLTNVVYLTVRDSLLCSTSNNIGLLSL